MAQISRANASFSKDKIEPVEATPVQPKKGKSKQSVLTFLRTQNRQKNGI